MNKVLQLTLGIMAALGGFVDVGELVFAVQAGSRFGYHLLWAVVVGTIGIIVYSEMCGRIAVVTHEAVFNTMRNQLGRSFGMVVLICSNIVNVMTCAAEIGGVAIILRLLFGGHYTWLIAGVTLLLIAVILILPFKWIERSFGLLGLMMLVFIAIAVMLHPDWGEAARGLVPQFPQLQGREYLLYGYFIVGIFSSLMMPYEVYFYSSGAIEEEWHKEELAENKLVTNVGFTLGAILTMALVIIGAKALMPKGISPDLLGTSVLPGAITMGQKGVALALLGMLFSIAGASVETCLAGAYNFAQFFHFRWGRHFSPRETPRFTACWIAIFLLAMLVVMTGIDPVKLVEYSVVFAVVVLPFTYLPILLLADNKDRMGRFANGPLARTLGWLFFVIVSITALAAVPLMVLTHMGRG